MAEVCLANSARVVYSLDIREPGADFRVLTEKDKRLKYIQTDVTLKESVEKAIAMIYDNEGGLDGFIANAGMTKHQPALDFDDEQLQQIFELNVSSVHFAVLQAENRALMLSLSGFRHLPLRYCGSSVMDSKGDQRLNRLYSIHDLISAE